MKSDKQYDQCFLKKCIGFDVKKKHICKQMWKKRKKKKKKKKVLLFNNTAEIAAVLNMLGMQVDMQQFF